MRLVHLPRADEDLLDVWTRIALDDPATADHYVDRIRAKLLRLRDYPESAPARDDIAPGLRGFSIGAYLVLYRLMDDEVQIVRILHGARDFRQIGF